MSWMLFEVGENIYIERFYFFARGCQNTCNHDIWDMPFGQNTDTNNHPKLPANYCLIKC